MVPARPGPRSAKLDSPLCDWAGRCICASGLREAIPCYQKCLDLGSRDAKAAYHLGNACKSLKRLNEAVEAYLKALEWDPDHVGGDVPIGQRLSPIERSWTEHGCAWKKCCSDRPGDLTTLVCLGNVLRSQDDLVGAVGGVQKGH